MSPSRKALTARSVLASVLLGTEPPALPTALLVATAELFGISEGTTRTALSRMVAAGEAEADGTSYRLVGRLVARQQRQQASRRAATRAWDGTWELAVVDGDGRRSATDRAALREALATLRLAEVREGVWARPDNLDVDRSPEAAAVARAQCRWWRGAQPAPPPDPTVLWDLAGWAADAAALVVEMTELQDPLDAHDRAALGPGFVTSAAVLRHLQADPLLPVPLLPKGWPGDELRAAYDRYDAAYRAVLRDWFAEATAR
jgi:phenylacetic acid degradation operon negative regulatory protein